MTVQQFRERGTVRAIQWTEDNFAEVSDFVGTYSKPGGEVCPAFQIAPRKIGGARIHLSDGGTYYVRQGQWVVKRDSECWPMDAEDFHAAFEPEAAEDETPDLETVP